MAKTEKDLLDDASLDAFFEAGRADVAQPSETLMAAILQDAAAMQPPPVQAVAPAQVHRSLWREILSQIGGWPTLASMTTAAVAGVWIGFASPAQLSTLSGGMILATDFDTAEVIYEVEDLVPSYFGYELLSEEDA